MMAAVRWPGAAAHVLLWLACSSLCWRIVPADLSSLPSGKARQAVELDSDWDGIDAKGYESQLKTEFSASEAQRFASNMGESLTGSDGSDSDRQSESRSISVVQGQEWKRTLEEIAEWIFHACVVVLAIFVMYYTISCICACCIGLDLLAEIWRVLGGWQAFYYFVRVEQSVAETDPEPFSLLSTAAEEP